jgi:hypothetical protein
MASSHAESWCSAYARRTAVLQGPLLGKLPSCKLCCAVCSWDSANSAEDGGQSERFVLRKKVEVPVPPGQLELGQLLLKGMYCPATEAAADPEPTQEQLLQLLRLADRWVTQGEQSVCGH